MHLQPRASSPSVSRALPLIAGAIGVGIFLVDTFTTLDIAIAVLYVIVVLVAANFLHRRGVMIVAALCAGLTVFGYLVSHGLSTGTALFRCLVSLFAIGVATLLALRDQAATAALLGQARLLDLTHDAIFVRDMNGLITYWNRGAEVLYGWSAEEANGEAAHDLLRTRFPAAVDAITAQMFSTGRWEGEITHTRRDGTLATVASRWSLRRDERGQPAAILETDTDITERKRAGEALQQAQTELAHVTRVTTLGEFTASIAHEVNQPLAGIFTNAEASLRWLDREPPQIKEARGAMERVIRDAERASGVVRRIRDLTKKATPEMTRLDINDVVNDAMLLVQREVANHRVALQLDLASGLPWVRGDRVQLQQVIINLVINGMEAMAGVPEAQRRLQVRTRAHDEECVLVAVQDAGVGIDPENANRLFSAFYTTKSGGMGMGLSICRSIVDAHGGRIWAVNNEGPGATIQFTVREFCDQR
jgi:two-component system, LuxR family, sensor kinase FixL